MRALALASLVAVATLATACSPKDDAATTDTAAATATATPTTTGAAAAPALNDAQVAHVAVTASSIDSAAGVTAQSKARHADVKAFARMMVQDHAGVNKQAVALATRLGVTPEDNDVSRSLQDGAKQAADGMNGLTGAAFDKAYIDREVAYHQAVLDALDQTLVPATQNAELKKLLQDARPNFVAHLERAKQIQSTLAAR
jgi:putative membrane protein